MEGQGKLTVDGEERNFAFDDIVRPHFSNSVVNSYFECRHLRTDLGYKMCPELAEAVVAHSQKCGEAPEFNKVENNVVRVQCFAQHLKFATSYYRL